MKRGQQRLKSIIYVTLVKKKTWLQIQGTNSRVKRGVFFFFLLHINSVYSVIDCVLFKGIILHSRRENKFLMFSMIFVYVM